jgi:hypothetical protein
MGFVIAIPLCRDATAQMCGAVEFGGINWTTLGAIARCRCAIGGATRQSKGEGKYGKQLEGAHTMEPLTN